MDTDKMQGSIQLAMAQGIESSKLALIIVTKEYQKKVNGEAPSGLQDNCFLEFKHCLSKLTPSNMICVIRDKEMTRDADWVGVFGMNMGGRIYVDMTGDLLDKDYLQRKISELEKVIGPILRSSNQRPPENAVPPVEGKVTIHISYFTGPIFSQS